MFETLTMRSSPARSAASIAWVSRRTCSRVGEETRNIWRTPAHAASSDAGSARSPSTHPSCGRRAIPRTSAPLGRGAPTTRPPRSPAAPITNTVTATTFSYRADAAEPGTAQRGSHVMRDPRPGPGIGHTLTPAQQLACALRILAHEGWRENLSGHITVATDDGGMWCNPWGLWWDEVRGSDVLRLDADGDVVEGKWDVTPAVFLHTELHRVRPDAAAIVHNHPYYATLLAVMRELPRVVHQNSCILDGELVFVDEYGGVDDTEGGKWLAREVGDASG